MQDPAERLYSSWKMMNRQPCPGAGQNRTTPKCAVPSLANLTQGILPSTVVKPGCSPADAVRALPSIEPSDEQAHETPVALILLAQLHVFVCMQSRLHQV